MNKHAYRQNALVGFVGVGDISGSDGLVCPKPRRFGHFSSASQSFIPPPLLQINDQEAESCHLQAGAELLDVILSKGRYDVEDSNSPPFFCGSPPSRTSNPLIQDAHFRNGLQIPESSAAAPPSSSLFMTTGGGVCVRGKFGNKSAPVRIEGFNCRGSCSISAVA